MRLDRRAVLVGLFTVLVACGGDGLTSREPLQRDSASLVGSGLTARQPAARSHVATGTARPTKVLTVIEENHSYRQMRKRMPYLHSLARRYAYASHYTAVTHPSLPNYLALAGGSTFRVDDDDPPVSHQISGRSVFDQALDAGRSAKTYAESMPRTCAPFSTSHYAVRHNPWAYFVTSRARCNRFDVPLGSPMSGAFQADIAHNALPNVGLAIPNICHDAHDCSLHVADNWLRKWLPQLLTSRDFTSGRLTVVITADEDDFASGNHVLTVVLQAGLSHQVVTQRLNHYSLLGYFDRVLGVSFLGHAKRGFAHAFGL